jgi:hypothetical protein
MREQGDLQDLISPRRVLRGVDKEKVLNNNARRNPLFLSKVTGGFEASRPGVAAPGFDFLRPL